MLTRIYYYIFVSAVLHCMFFHYSWSFRHSKVNSKIKATILFKKNDNFLNLAKDGWPYINSKLKSINKYTVLKISIISGPLGMLLDNYHGLFGVLSYEQIGFPITIQNYNNQILLQSALWVPFLFAFAGLAMSTIGLFLDEILQTNLVKRNPSGPKTLYSIATFSFQYYLSGLLDNIHTPVLTTNVILFLFALIGFIIYDNSIAGLILAILTAISGTTTEIILINLFHLYKYNNSDIIGICSWIPWVYFLGAPAVFNLTRLLNK